MTFHRVFSVLALCAAFVLFDPRSLAQVETPAPAKTMQQDTTSAQGGAAAAKPKLDVPYVPTPYDVADAMLKMADVKTDDVVYDLGCGDGRIVIAAARDFGARGVGIDIDPERIHDAEQNARKEGVEDRVKFIEQNLFDADLRKASVVTLYLLSGINLKLKPKLLRELKPGTRVVSHGFDMGDWEPEKSENVDGRTIYYWVIPENKQGGGK